MAERPAVELGGKSSWSRVFTVEDVRLFSEVSGDRGVHHVELDEQSRLMVQGLLTATLPTKLGTSTTSPERCTSSSFGRSSRAT